MTALTPDETYGPLREATEVRPWENGFSPRSLTELDTASCAALQAIFEAAAHTLFSHAAHAMKLIWVMDADCRIWIAIEEISPHEKPSMAGLPNFANSTDKKLGHPTLRPNAPARIAGELFLHLSTDGTPQWILNTSSGRFCRQFRPTSEQRLAILARFNALMGGCVTMDQEP